MTVATSHVTIDDRGIARIDGSRARVSMVVIDFLHGQTPEQIHEGYPHLSLAQIHSALAYYYDHKSEIDAEIEEGHAQAEALRNASIASGNQPTREELLRRRAERQPKP
jgi:uncharacterized protein (DUF433 family)